MSITSKSQTENSEEYLNKLLSLSNDDFIKITNKKTAIDNSNKSIENKDNSIENDSINK
ncbi:MAG: hypothetical protein ACRC68_10495 [Clostridium sp.]